MATVRCSSAVLALLALSPLVFLGQADAIVKDRPVMKVVRMLNDMKEELESELADDKKVNEMLGCWCKTNREEKTKAIELGEAQEAQLESDLDGYTASMNEEKQARIEGQNELQGNRKSLDEAETIRSKENADFHKEETFLLDAIAACKQAITVLSEYHPQLAQVKAVAHKLHEARVPQLALSSGTTKKADLDALRVFLRQAEGASSFLAIPVFSSYAPRSGAIFGILQQMQTDFEASLAKARAAENKTQTEFSDLRSAKSSEIQGTEGQLDGRNVEIGSLAEKYATAKKDLEDTQAQLAMDRAFLADLEKKCAESAEEFEARTKSRMEEIVAVEDTIQILNDDEAFAVADKTVNSVPVQFLQVSATKREQFLRSRASALLQKTATRLGSPKLAVVAASAQLDAFTKVKEEIDKLIEELLTQQKDEVDTRDWCIEEFAVNERETSKNEDLRTKLEAKEKDLEGTIEQLTKEIDDATAAIAELQEQMKKGSENREAQNAVYQETMTDHRLMQMILLKAKDRMAQVYAFLQQQGRAEPEQPGAAHTATSGNHTNAGNAPVRFDEYKQNAGGSRVVNLLQEIIVDSKRTEEAEMAAEKDAQVAYESFMKDSNTEITMHTEAIAHKTEARAKAKEDLVMTKEDLAGTIKTLEELDKEKGDLHTKCDFLIKNFEARQQARDAEVDALREAKAILSGMN